MAIATYRPGYDRDRRSIGERRQGVRSRGAALRSAGAASLHAALALLLIWQGAQAFSAHGAQSVAQHALHSPLVSWVYDWFGVQAVSIGLGAWQIAAGLLIAARWIAPAAGAIGAAMALAALALSASFLFTTPGVAAPGAGGLPALSVEVGLFLLKDIVLLAAALYVLGDSLLARHRP